MKLFPDRGKNVWGGEDIVETHSKAPCWRKNIGVCPQVTEDTVCPLFHSEKGAPGSESPSLRAPRACKPIVLPPSLGSGCILQRDVGPEEVQGAAQ